MLLLPTASYFRCLRSSTSYLWITCSYTCLLSMCFSKLLWKFSSEGLWQWTNPSGILYSMYLIRNTFYKSSSKGYSFGVFFILIYGSSRQLHYLTEATTMLQHSCINNTKTLMNPHLTKQEMTGGIALTTELIIFMETHTGKRNNWKAKAEDLNTIFQSCSQSVNVSFF